MPGNDKRNILTMRLSSYIGKYWASAEVMYAVIIAMTFTSILRGYDDAFGNFYYYIVFSALFCCVAWGIVDGLFYAWERIFITKTENKIIEYSKTAEGNEAAISLVKDELDDTILRNIDEVKRRELYKILVKHLAEVGNKEKPSTRDALNIILGTFLASTVAGIIVVFPFFLLDDLSIALGVSNLLGIFLLFIIGYYRTYNQRILAKMITGFGTSLIGIIIAVVTVQMGG